MPSLPMLTQRRKRVATALSTLVLLGVLLGYGNWKVAHLMRCAEGFLTAEDGPRAALMAQSVLQLRPEHAQARATLIRAYDTTKDPRLLDVLDSSPEEHLRRTLKAIEQGNLTEARASFALLQPGSTVDAISYHEIGMTLFRNDPEHLYAHCLALSEAEPDQSNRTLQLVYTCLMTGHAVSSHHRKKLTALALKRTDEIGGDALAACLALAMARPDTAETIALPTTTELTGLLQIRIEGSESVRPLYLRAFEMSTDSPTVDSAAILTSLKILCGRLQIAAETQKLAESLTKTQQFDQLIHWFNASPATFPIPDPEDRQTAFNRLLIADAAAHLHDWQTVKHAMATDTPTAWGELIFLRHFYQARAMRNTIARYLPDRYQHLSPGAQVSDAIQAASQPWQRDLLTQLNKKHPW